MEFFKNYSKTRHVNIVIKSWTDYNNHSINILRDCLKCWSKFENQHFNKSFKFRVIDIDPGEDKKLFFVATTVDELKAFHLDAAVVDNADLYPGNFMGTDVSNDIFSFVNNFAA